MKPFRIPGMVVLSLCWITCVIASAGAATGPGQGHIQGEAVAGQGTAQEMNTGQTGMLPGVQGNNGQSPGQISRDKPADAGPGSGNPAHENSKALAKNQSIAGPGPSGNLTSPAHRPQSSLNNQSEFFRPGNMTERSLPMDGGGGTSPMQFADAANRTGMDRTRPSGTANLTADAPRPDPGILNAPGLKGQSGEQAADDSRLSQSPDGPSESREKDSPSGSGSNDERNVATIIQSFLTWLNTPSAR